MAFEFIDIEKCSRTTTKVQIKTFFLWQLKKIANIKVFHLGAKSVALNSEKRKIEIRNVPL